MTKAKQNKHITFFNARLTSIISISLVLFVLGLIALISVLATEISRYVKENIELSLELKDNIKEKELNLLQKKLDKAEFTKSAYYISKENALKEIVDEMGVDPSEFLGTNPLSPIMEVKLKADYANEDSLKWIEKKISAFPGVINIDYQKDLIHLINENVKRIGFFLFGLALILMAISFALISNTIRLTAYAKRFLINTMKLVGASPGFIRKPFIIANIINGLIASIIAIGMLSGILYYMTSQIDNLEIITNWTTIIFVSGFVLVMGILLTTISAYFAINRYIRMNQDNLYYI